MEHISSDITSIDRTQILSILKTPPIWLAFIFFPFWASCANLGSFDSHSGIVACIFLICATLIHAYKQFTSILVPILLTASFLIGLYISFVITTLANTIIDGSVILITIIIFIYFTQTTRPTTIPTATILPQNIPPKPLNIVRVTQPCSSVVRKRNTELPPLHPTQNPDTTETVSMIDCF